MYRKIVVPLDGSELAECVLPYVENIAQRGEGLEVTFLHVIRRSELYYYDFTYEKRKRVTKYLEKKVMSARDKGINAHYEIIVGDPTEHIPEFAVKIGADQIIMTTDAPVCLGPLVVYGSVAERVSRSSSVTGIYDTSLGQHTCNGGCPPY